MQLNAILEQCREKLDDQVEKYLWSTDELVREISKAEEIVAEKLLLLKDSTTSAIVQIAITTPTAIYSHDSRILRIERAKLSTQTKKLSIIRENIWTYMDTYGGEDWENADAGEPTLLLHLWEEKKVRLYVPPIANATLNLVVFRKPATPLTISDLKAAPEILDRYHDGLYLYVLHKAYENLDTDKRNDKKSAEYGEKWRKWLDEEEGKLNRMKSDQQTIVPPLGTY
jgi:hypothetical protein